MDREELEKKVEDEEARYVGVFAAGGNDRPRDAIVSNTSHKPPLSQAVSPETNSGNESFSVWGLTVSE